MVKVVNVAVAILQKPDGQVLLASRPQGKGWAGWWEFPGGKIELGETPEAALSRELQEELGITPKKVQSWIIRRFDYPATHDASAKTVLLHFYFVYAWQGELQPLEGQQLSWSHPQSIEVQPILPANAPIMKALALPPIYAISNLAEMGEDAFLRALQAQLDAGLQMLQVRESHLSLPAFEVFSEQVLNLCQPYGAKVLLNNQLALALKIGADGVHYSSDALMQLVEKPKDLLVVASCHNVQELQKAKNLDLDFVVLSPVLNTKSQFETQELDWKAFGQVIENYTLPVYALGGTENIHLKDALNVGARGIAMQRACWFNKCG